ncbi:MAG TPA: hypothetical protein VN372_02355 [Methanospirillum sp.]|nr:hypothetical protein [Methanospirillum sp.]
MHRSQMLYLNDISQAAGNIRTYVGELTFEEFIADQMRVEAVVE